jgi:regulator of sirC expression with transglutaminase-like and TPR domain
MKSASYENLKKEEQELEQLKGVTYSLEGKACEVIKELLKELDKKKVKSNKKKDKKIE